MKAQQENIQRFDAKTLPKTFWQLFMLVIRYIPGEFKRYLPRSLTIGGIILVIHTFLLVIVNDGFNAGGGVINPFKPNFLMNTLSWIVDSTTSVTGHFWSSILFYGLLTAIITLLFSGFKNFGGFKRFQGMLLGKFRGVFRLFKEKSHKRIILALTGLAIASILSFIWKNALVSLMFLMVILRGMVIMQKGGLFHLLARVIRYDFNRIFRNKETDPESFTLEDTTLVYQGISLGMMITALPWLESYGLIVGGIALIAILIINNSRSKPQMANLLLILILCGIGLILASGWAFADDGGWTEYKRNFQSWIRGDGSKRAIILGLTAGLGGALGPIMVSILNGLGAGLGGGGLGGETTQTGGESDGTDPEDWEEDEDYDDDEYSEEEETEEEEEETQYFVSIQGEKGVLQADGKDSIWFFGKVHSTNPEADPGDLASRTQGISFDFGGPGDDWIQTRGEQYSQGHKVIQVRALAPEDADPDSNPTVTVTASSSGDSDSVSFSLKVAFRAELTVHFDGPSGIRPDGENSTSLVATIKFFPDNPDLEAEVAQTISFQTDSNWITLGSGSEGSGQKTTTLTAYPPGGDVDLDQPERIDIQVSAQYQGESLDKTIELDLNSLNAWIEINIDQNTLPIYKKQETYVHAWVMMQVGNESIRSDELSQTLQLKEPGDEGEWLVPSQIGFANEEAYFTVYAWYPYEEAGVDVPSTNQLKVYSPERNDIPEAEVLINLTPYPTANLVVTTPEETLRPDIEQVVQLRVGLQLVPEDAELELDEFWARLDIEVEGQENGWLELFEGEIEGNEKIFDIGCKNQTGDEKANPPETIALMAKGTLFGEEITASFSIQLEPIPLPEIQISFERNENTELPIDTLLPDGQDFITLLATLTMAEEIEGVDLEKLTSELSILPQGNASNWIELSEEAFDAGGGEPVKYLDIYALLKTAEQRKSTPGAVSLQIKGEITGREFSKEVEIKLMTVPELTLEYQFDRKLESPIPEDQIALTGEDWIEIQAWFELSPKMDSIDQSAIQKEMKFWHLSESDSWLTFSDETEIQTGDGLLGRSVKITGIPHPETEASEIPDQVDIRIACTYLGEEIQESIPVRILGKPTLEVDHEEVILGSGDENQKVTVVAEVSNTVEEGWSFELDPNPELASVELKPDKDRCEIIFTPGLLDEGVEEPLDEEIKVVARKGDFEISQPLKVILSPIGLFIHSEMPVVIPIEKKEAFVSYSVRMIVEGKAQLDTATMKSGMEFSNPIEDAPDEIAKNAFKQAGFVMQFDGFYGETGAEDAQIAKYKLVVENILPGPPSQKIEAPITLSVPGKEDPVFTKEITIQLELQDIEAINAALEKQRCDEIVRKYIPGSKQDEFFQMIEEQEGLFGAEEYFELRKMIWERASEMLLQEAAEWEEQEKWLGRIQTFLEYTDWVCDLAVRVLATATLGPSAGSALMVKTFIKQGLVGYAEGVPFSTTVYNIVSNMIVTKPGDTFLDADYLAQHMPKPAAYAIYFTYKFLWGIYYDKKTAYQSAKDAFVEFAEDQLVGWLTPKVKEWGEQKGLTSKEDYDIANKATKQYTIDELPPAAKAMAQKIKNGQADYDDVINCMKDPQVMRALKNAPEDVRIAFNKTLRENFYDKHDNAVKNYLNDPANSTGKPWEGKELEVDDFRTPSSTPGDDLKDINTDRDYRVRYKNDGGEWIEIPRDVWENESHNQIKTLTGEDPVTLRQEATDKSHPEASLEYSDQGYKYIPDPDNPGKFKRVKAEVDSSYLSFKDGDSTELIDPEGLAKMYQHKCNEELAKGDSFKPEAMAQSQKAIGTVEKFRESLESNYVEVPEIPKNIQEAMDVVKNAATDHTATPDEVEAKLSSLGITGGIKQMNDIVCGYIESFKWMTDSKTIT